MTETKQLEIALDVLGIKGFSPDNLLDLFAAWLKLNPATRERLQKLNPTGQFVLLARFACSLN